MAKYQIGDIVRIKKGLQEGIDEIGRFTNRVMADKAGVITRVEDIIPDFFGKTAYKLSLPLDTSRFTWWKAHLKTVFRWKDLENNKIQVHLPNIEAAEDFFKKAHAKGFKWCSGDSMLDAGNAIATVGRNVSYDGGPKRISRHARGYKSYLVTIPEKEYVWKVLD